VIHAGEDVLNGSRHLDQPTILKPLIKDTRTTVPELSGWGGTPAGSGYKYPRRYMMHRPGLIEDKFMDTVLVLSQEIWPAYVLTVKGSASHSLILVELVYKKKTKKKTISILILLNSCCNSGVRIMLSLALVHSADQSLL
jgi:hypothetical protein